MLWERLTNQARDIQDPKISNIETVTSTQKLLGKDKRSVAMSLRARARQKELPYKNVTITIERTVQGMKKL